MCFFHKYIINVFPADNSIWISCAKINEIVKEEWTEDFLGECRNKQVKQTKNQAGKTEEKTGKTN